MILTDVVLTNNWSDALGPGLDSWNHQPERLKQQVEAEEWNMACGGFLSHRATPKHPQIIYL